MTIQSLFPDVEAATQKPKPIRFKVIRPVYETLVVRDDISSYFGNGTRYTDPEQVFQAFRWLNKETKEYFIVLHLSCRNELICIDVVSIGSMNQSVVNIREIYKSVLLSSAMAILVLHNHPSQKTEPSREDIQIVRRIKEAGELLNVKLLDSIIIGESYFSFVSAGLM